MKARLLVPLLLALGYGCHSKANVQATTYDELAHGNGHWEWLSTGYESGLYTPATEGYTRQLVFGADSRLTLRRSGQPDYHTGYRLATGPATRCVGERTPTIAYDTNEKQLVNNTVKTYSISQQNGRKELSLVGESACFDGGAYEQYYWVAE